MSNVIQFPAGVPQYLAEAQAYYDQMAQLFQIDQCSEAEYDDALRGYAVAQHRASCDDYTRKLQSCPVAQAAYEARQRAAQYGDDNDGIDADYEAFYADTYGEQPEQVYALYF